MTASNHKNVCTTLERRSNCLTYIMCFLAFVVLLYKMCPKHSYRIYSNEKMTCSAPGHRKRIGLGIKRDMMLVCPVFCLLSLRQLTKPSHGPVSIDCFSHLTAFLYFYYYSELVSGGGTHVTFIFY